jgi:hypothetical protein
MMAVMVLRGLETEVLDEYESRLLDDMIDDPLEDDLERRRDERMLEKEREWNLEVRILTG